MRILPRGLGLRKCGADTRIRRTKGGAIFTIFVIGDRGPKTGTYTLPSSRSTVNPSGTPGNLPSKKRGASKNDMGDADISSAEGGSGTKRIE